jgi:hypothetical protein
VSSYPLARRQGLSVSQFLSQAGVFTDTRYSWHAEQAVKQYQHLFYPDGDSIGEHLLSDDQIEIRDGILEDAYMNLAQAEMDHVEIQCDYAERREQFKAIYGFEPTAKDVSKVCLHRHSKKYLLAVGESMQSYEAFIERAFGPEQGDNDSR